MEAPFDPKKGFELVLAGLEDAGQFICRAANDSSKDATVLLTVTTPSECQRSFLNYVLSYRGCGLRFCVLFVHLLYQIVCLCLTTNLTGATLLTMSHMQRFHLLLDRSKTLLSFTLLLP